MIETSSEAIEAFHLTFLAYLSKDPNKAVVKGGQNLRLFFESVRHSDDLDMDVSITSRGTLKKKVDKILASPRFKKALLLYGIEVEQVSTPKQTLTVRAPFQPHTTGSKKASPRRSRRWRGGTGLATSSTWPCSWSATQGTSGR